MAETDYAEMVQRAYDTLRMLGRSPLAHDQLQGMQMQRAIRHTDELRHRIRRLPLDDLERTLVQQPEPYRPPTNIYTGERGEWMREPD